MLSILRRGADKKDKRSRGRTRKGRILSEAAAERPTFLALGGNLEWRANSDLRKMHRLRSTYAIPFPSPPQAAPISFTLASSRKLRKSGVDIRPAAGSRLFDLGDALRARRFSCPSTPTSRPSARSAGRRRWAHDGAFWARSRESPGGPNNGVKHRCCSSG